MQVCKEAYGIYYVWLMLHLFFNHGNLLEYALSMQDYSVQKVK